MNDFMNEARSFGTRKLAETAHARQVAALQLACGIDIAEVTGATPQRRAELVRRVERVIERERLKGMRRHWSYDLNRHIALKQVLDILKAVERTGGAPVDRGAAPIQRAKANGARRRR